MAAPTRAGRARSWALLALAAVGSAALYLVLALAFPLSHLGLVPRLDLGELTGREPPAVLLLLAGLVAVFLLYWLGAVVARALSRERFGLPAVLGLGLLLHLSALLAYPVAALDVFGYLAQGNIAALHGANPFLAPPAAYGGDPLLPLLAWPEETSNYGALWGWLSIGISAWAHGDILRGVVLFKLLGVVFSLAMAVAVHRLMDRQGPEKALPAALLVAWSPLLVFEVAVNGHNDVVMACLATVALLSQARGRPAVALPSLLASALVKFVSVIYLPAFLLSWLRGHARAGVARLGLGLLLAGVLVGVAYGPLWAGLDSLGFLKREGLFTASPAALTYQLLGGYENPAAAPLVSIVFGGAFLAVAGWRTWRVSGAWQGLGAACFDLTLAYLALGAFWFQPWYVVLLLPWAVTSGGVRRATGLALSASAFLNYLVYQFLWFWFVDWLSEPLRQALAVLCIFGPPAVVWLVAGARRRPALAA